MTNKSLLIKEAVAEPLAIKVASGRFLNPLPSPLNEPEKEPEKEPVKLPLNDVALPVKEPVNCPVTLSKSKLLTNPLLPWSSETTIAGEPESEAEKFGTPKFGST